MLSNVNSICLMFDGWTDKYKARPYLGVRVSLLHNWTYKVVTLGCHVLHCHTSRAIADHIHLILKEFFPDHKKLYITSCHDGAANMIKTSTLFKVDSFQHCASQGLHLLLTTYRFNALEDVMDIIRKCREIVSALHFKTLLMKNEMAAINDKSLIEDIQQNFADVNKILDLDDQVSKQKLHLLHASMSIKT